MAYLAQDKPIAVVVPAAILLPWPSTGGGGGGTATLYLTTDGRIVSTITPPAGARLIAYSV